jgi:hypothetical protein
MAGALSALGSEGGHGKEHGGLAPVILVHPNGNDAAYIAVDGWRM